MLTVFQEASHFFYQLRKVIGYDVPDNPVIDHIVTVDKNISESDDPSVISDAGCHLFICSGKAVQGFSDDLELPLYSCP